MFHKRLLKEFADNRKYVAQMVKMKWWALIMNVILMGMTAGYISQIYEKNITIKKTLVYITVLITVLVVRAITNRIGDEISFKSSTNVKKKLRELIYTKLTELGTEYKDTVTTSEAVQISTEGVEQLEIYFGKYIPQFFYSMLAPITLFVIVAAISLKVAVVLLICVPLIPVSIIAVQKFAKKMLDKYWGTYTELGDSFLEGLQGLTTLKIYKADERYADKMDREAEKFRKITMKVLIMQLNSISVMDLVAYGGAAVGIILSILEYRSGNMNLAECFFIIMISAEFFLPLRLLGSFFHIAMNGNAAANKIFRLLDTKSQRTGIVKDISGSSIRLKNVSYQYEDSDSNVLCNIALEIKERGITALVGESGCGKSTIASLIMGEQAGYSGMVRIGNTEVKDADETALFSKVTRIRHDSYLFKGSVRENLLMGNAFATDDECINALEKVDLSQTIFEKGGLDMQLCEKASNLSGGQKQRLALARAILHESDIYIFDEATSNIDVESENRIMQVVLELAKTKTILLISHRLANVVPADTILIMHNGEIIEQGTHNELIDNKKYYYELYSKQQELENYGTDVYEMEAAVTHE